MVRTAIALEQRLTASPAVVRYALALSFFGVALLGRIALTGFLPAQGFPFLTFFPAVLLAAYFAGLGPGLLTSALSVLAAWYFFFLPARSLGGLSPPDVVAIVFFSAILVIDCVVVHVMKTALARVQQTQQRLRDSEQRLRLVIDNLFVYVGLLDLQGWLREVNDAPVQRIRQTREAVINRPFWETPWWAGDTLRQDTIRAAITRAAAGETVRYDVEIQASPDERFTIDFQVAPLRGSDGEISALVASGVDVSARVNALADLEHSRAEALAAAAVAEGERRVLDATFNAVPASIIVADAHGKLLRMNQACERIWGIAPYSQDVDSYAEWKGWWADGSARHGHRIQPHEWGLARSLQGESCAQVVEIEPFGRPGERRVTLLSSAPVFDPAGAVAGGVVAQADITERIQTEQALRESQQLLQSTMDNFPTAIAFKDREGRFLDVNKALETTLGLEREKIRGLGPHDILPPEAADRIREHELAVMRTRRAIQAEQVRQLPGGTFHHLDTTFPLIDARGEVYGVGHISHDISDRKRAEQALSAVNEQLRLADRQKDEFLATLAHELRNPLAPIRSAAELIRLRNPADEMVRRSRDIIERQVLHLTRLVDDLLDVSRITMGTVQLRHEELDLVAVTAAAVDSVRPLLDAAGLSLQQQLGPGTVPVRGDNTRLAQCIVNLLTNAVKFTPRGGRVAVQVAACDGLAVIEVSDSGIGIAPEDLERIFELFVQVQQSGIGGNTGLGIGLALTRKLIALHGGRVHAANAQSGTGSIFRIELPRAGAINPQDTSEAATSAARVDSGSRILVVDDNRDAADTLADVLSMSGFEVSVAYSGESALAALARTGHDAVLLDIGLPDIDGYEVCRRIRAGGAHPQPVVVALTGWSQEKDRDAAAAAGFNAHLSKPADTDRVMAVVNGQLNLLRQGLRPELAAGAG